MPTVILGTRLNSFDIAGCTRASTSRARLQHLFLAREAHARLRSELTLVVGDRSGEPGRARQTLHLFLDARNFVEADLVDALGRQARRRVGVNQRGVRGLSVLERSKTDLSARQRPIRAAQERLELRPARDERLHVRAARSRTQPLLVGRADLTREAPERDEQRRVVRRCRSLRDDLIECEIDDDRGLCQAGGQLLLHQRDRLVDERRQVAQPRDDVLVVPHGPQRHLVDDVEHLVVHAVGLRRALNQIGVRLDLELRLQLRDHQPGAETVRGVQIAGLEI